MDADMISKQEAEDELAAMEQPFGNFMNDDHMVIFCAHLFQAHYLMQ